MLFRKFLFFSLLLTSIKAYSQQDVTFHLNAHLFPGQKILKVKRDFYDPYVWVLAANNVVYRVNSLTMAIDDYTATFSAYSNLQFVDIAGRSQDTVFIAANSTNVIHYKNGTIKVIGSSGGIPGIVNSIGIATRGVYNVQSGPPLLMIASSAGFCLYDCDAEKITSTNNSDSKVYEATYRTELYKDSSAATSDFITTDTVQYQPAAFIPEDGSIDVGYLWEGGNEFGYNINTATTVYEAIYIFNPVFTNFFWGTDKGLFQNTFDSSYKIMGPTENYLPGIKVNKVTNIYGLTTFGSGQPNDTSPFIKQNLLIGTDKGFYFSSSVYNSASFFGILRIFSLFHDDELGNININDICVNPASTSIPICENGVWLGADDGLYLLKPDYGAYLGSQQLNAISFNNQPNTLSDLKLCAGDTTQAIINTSAYTGNSFQWYKNGQELPTQSNDSLTITTAGDYYAVLYDPCEGIHLESNHLTVSLVTAPVFSFNYPDEIQLCSGTPDTLKTENTAGYHYQWYTNDVLNGDTTASYAVTQSGKYKVEVSACTNSWVPSKEVQVYLVQLPVPVIATDKPAYCTGDLATLSIAVPPNPSYTINWYNNNALLANSTNKSSITTSISGNYTVSVVNDTVNTDGTICAQTSTVQALSFNPIPAVSIKEIINTTICDGQTIALVANYNGGTVQWSTGETTDQINVTTSGAYKAMVTSPAGCQADTSINVTFFPNPVLSINDTSICTYKKQAITLTGPPGFAQYAWNGQPGGQTYIVTQPQTVSLTVTDTNGCQATQEIKVADQCPNIFIPNTFTPNGDGINDTWVIEGLDASSNVKVFTRYGTEIYQSTGYTTPWNGEYNGKRLPTGVYYYIVNAKNGTQKFSGSLTILY